MPRVLLTVSGRTQMFTSALTILLITVAGAGGARRSEERSTCLSGDRQFNVCFSTTPTVAATALAANATSPDSCCSACLQSPQCYCWTYDSRHDSETGGCELKHILQSGSTTSPHCVSGNVMSPLPITPPLVPPPLPPPAGAHSVLFLVVDDLRPQLSAYSASLPETPHIDRLVATGLRFDRAYVQWPVCAPSRNRSVNHYAPYNPHLSWPKPVAAIGYHGCR